MIGSGYLKENKEIIQKLRKIPALDFFKDEDLQGILKLSRMIKYEPGELIIEEGRYDNWIYFLISGKVRIQKKGETITVLNRRGDLFGEMGIIDGSPRSASVVAVDETVCLAMDASYTDRLKESDRVAFNSILYRVFAEILVNRLRIADEELVKAKAENAMLRAELNKLRN
ncbi:hypothetical protein ES703_57658 [subsurface metagenome]